MTGSFDMIDLFRILLLSVLVLCAVCAVCSKKLLTTVVVYMSYSAVMAILWMLLRSPDLAITEAAVGAGVSSILFFLCLRRIGSIGGETEKSGNEKQNPTEKDEKSPEKGAKKAGDSYVE